MSISVFSNFRINDDLRFERLKISFESFNAFNFENWVINIRGKYRNQVYEYLSKNIPKTKLEISVQDYSENWFNQSQKIFKKIRGNYVFLWNEDHINIAGNKNFEKIINEIEENNIDQFRYTWFHSGKNSKIAKLANFRESQNIIYDNYTLKKHSKRLKLIDNHNIQADRYIISMTSIFKKNFFEKILFKNDPLIKRWDKKTPFDFEKCSYDIHWLPFKMAYPKNELFASIDDNHGQVGYSLIDRGLLNNNLRDENKLEKREKNYTLKNLILYPFRKTKIILREIINYTYSRIVYFFKKND
jgi:hypothetical protein